MTPSLLPQSAFSDTEESLFDDIVDQAEIDALVDVLFPDELLRSSVSPTT
jgi:hypothetical protein